MTQRLRLWISAAFLVGPFGFGAAGTALAQQAILSASKMIEAHRVAVSQSGIVLIESVADARSDIRERDERRARREIRKSLRLCHQIADASPSLRLASLLTESIHALAGGEKAAAQLAPIYAQLDVYQRVAETIEIRAEVERASNNLEAGEVELAVADLKRATTKIEFFEVDLPIQETYALLHLANDDFERGDARMADTRLRKIQGSLRSFATIAAIEVDEVEFGGVDVDVAAPAN